MSAPPLLEVQGLVKHFPVGGGLLRRARHHVKAVDGVSFDVGVGETVGLVGESGSGKTTVGRSILRLVRPTAGSVTFAGQDVLGAGRRRLKALRRDMQIVFQDPVAALDPRRTVGASVAEGMRIHRLGRGRERQAAVLEVLDAVGLERRHLAAYPHELSGGQLQRVGIARALALRPRFLVLDEPVSALDVSIQAQIVNLLEDLQREFGLTYLFIAHDLSVVEHISDRVVVMYLGAVVEEAPKRAVYRDPVHPYTRALLSAIPSRDPAARARRIVLAGEPPSPVAPPEGCRFRTRCPFAMEQCREQPPLREVAPGHRVACWLVS